MKIMKFGGTSVGSPERMRNVARLICETDGPKIVVLSAMSGTTNSLLAIAAELEKGNVHEAEILISTLKENYHKVAEDLFSTPKWRDSAIKFIDEVFNLLVKISHRPYSSLSEREIVAQGEILSTNLVYGYFQEQNIDIEMISALDFMKTDEHGEPDLNIIKSELQKILDSQPGKGLFLTQGFICRNPKGEIDNLMRGGSDYTASIIGAVVNADEVQIWTDIDGMHNNDPRFVEETVPVHNLHFEEAAELAYFGAKILHPTCILPAKLNNIPVRLLNTMDPKAEGTTIGNTLDTGSIKAVAAKDNITAIKIKSSRMLLAYGFLKKVFEIFEKYETPIDMIATSEVGVSLTIDNDKHLKEIVADLEELGTVTIDTDMVIICVVGDLDWQNRGFEAKALDALRNIPVRMISYGGSNYNVSFLIRKQDKVKALRLLSYHLF
ncbi:MAG: aspartate kinase [Muribaculaceae bacterium]|nr:aspartate kinase [Muribaculaceae bacterium]